MDKRKLQIAYGIIIIVVGISVLYRIPQVMLQVESIESFKESLLFIKLCFYFLGVVLIFAGLKKLHKFYYRLFAVREDGELHRA